MNSSLDQSKNKTMLYYKELLVTNKALKMQDN